VGCSREITGLVVSVVTFLAMGVATAQDTTWKECELADRDPDRSIVACSRLLNRSSSRLHAEAFHNRGLAFAAKGNLDQAISDISAGIRLDPQRAYRSQERGELYTRQGKYQQGIADITEAIRRDPTPRAFRFHNRAEAYRGLGDLTRAIADFDEAIRLDPVARSFRFHDRGNALRDAGQYDRALIDYQTALKLAPTNAWILLESGRAYARMGRPEAAKRDFNNALTLDPSNEELRRLIEVELAVLANIPSTIPPPPPTTPRTPPPKQAEKEISSGSAFVVSRKGHLLTNDHVVSECPILEIGGVGTAVVVSKDSKNDLALIQAKTQAGLELEPLKVRSKSTRLGEEVIALGYPLRGVLGDGLNVTTGTISALSGINFAIGKEIAVKFLESHGVSLEAMEDGAAMTVADIAQQARKSVLPILCRK
jgi:tetratricopeptide (TPR) repeat protein